jgi:nitroreductase
MELIDGIRGRRSVRAYLPDVVERSEIEALINAAILAPSAVNQQLWGFLVIQDRALLTRYSDEIKPRVLATLAHSGLPPSFAGTLRDPGYHIFHEAPALVVIYATSEDPFASIDCCLAAENLMLAAHARGLGSCWIGLSQGFFDDEAMKPALGVPPGWHAVAPIILGHARELPAAPPRRKPEVIWRG